MTPLWWTRDIAPGDIGARVLVVQRMLLCMPTGVMDNSTVAAVRGFQIALGLAAHGWVDEETARALGPRLQDDLMPEWWTGDDMAPGDPGYEEAVRELGGQAGLRRFQGNNGLPATGVINEMTARLLGAMEV